MFDYKSLIAIRKRLGLSQAKMGELLCVSKVQIARLEAQPHAVNRQTITPAMTKLLILILDHHRRTGALPDFALLEAAARKTSTDREIESP